MIDWTRLISKDWDKYYPLYIQSDVEKKRKEVLNRGKYLAFADLGLTRHITNVTTHIGNKPYPNLQTN